MTDVTLMRLWVWLEEPRRRLELLTTVADVSSLFPVFPVCVFVSTNIFL